MNNEQDLSRYDVITILFSEDMNPATINENTFRLMQRTTPSLGEYRSQTVDGIITYNGRTATFTPNQKLVPSQEYGNVFTVELTTGAKDLAGNSISHDYIWSFTTGEDAFNTGATTSQSDQSSVPVVTPVVVPTQTLTPSLPATTAAPITTSSTLPWAWIIGALLLLLLIALFFMLANKKPVRQKNISTGRPNPFGDVHPVIDIEGIGPQYSKALQAMGIKNTEQLWKADTGKIARGTGASLSAAKSWQNMAELASIKDIGPQYAELLERSGIHSINQLKNTNPTKLLKLVNEKQESLKINIQGNHPGHAMVEHWIEEAQDHKFSESKGQEA